MEKHFPNGFTSWMETHHEVVDFITSHELHEPGEESVIKRRREAQGTGGIYELAEEWTDEFEKKYKGEPWGQDGGREYFDTVWEFLKEKNKS